MRLDHQANEKQAAEGIQYVTLVKQTTDVDELEEERSPFHIGIRIKIGGNISLKVFYFLGQSGTSLCAN